MATCLQAAGSQNALTWSQSTSQLFAPSRSVCSPFISRAPRSKCIRNELTWVRSTDDSNGKSGLVTEQGPARPANMLKQLMLHDANFALAAHFKHNNQGLWLSVQQSDATDAMYLTGSRGLVLKRKSGEPEWYHVWCPSAGVVLLHESQLETRPTFEFERLGKGWTAPQAALILAGPDQDGMQLQRRKKAPTWPSEHPGAIAAWYEVAENGAEQRWGCVKATPMTVSCDIAGLSGCLIASHDDTGDGRGGWRTINIPTHGIMSVLPCEFSLEEEGTHPPVLRPWWAVLRPTEWARSSRLEGHRALVFAKGVSGNGRQKRGMWWTWVEGHGFQEVTSQELSGACQDKVVLGSPDHLPISIAQGCTFSLGEC